MKELPVPKEAVNLPAIIRMFMHPETGKHTVCIHHDKGLGHGPAFWGLVMADLLTHVVQMMQIEEGSSPNLLAGQIFSMLGKNEHPICDAIDVIADDFVVTRASGEPFDEEREIIQIRYDDDLIILLEGMALSAEIWSNVFSDLIESVVGMEMDSQDIEISLEQVSVGCEQVVEWMKKEWDKPTTDAKTLLVEEDEEESETE